MKKDNNARTPEEIAAARSAAAKKAAATRKAKAEAAKAAEAEAARKAAEEEKSSSTAAVIVDGTEAKAEATNDTASANAKVADNGTKAEASTNGDGTSSSSSAVIVLPAGDTGKNDAQSQSAQYVAPATYSDNQAAPNEGQKGEGLMKKVLSIMGWVFALVLLALLVVALLCTKGCNGVATKSTPSAISDTSADAEAKISALSAALAAKDAENEALREQLASAPAPVNVNVDNSNTVVVDNAAIAEAQAEAKAWQDRYYQVFDHCNELEVINGNLENRCGCLEAENAELRAREPGTSVVYVDRDVIKTVTVTDTSEVDRLTAELSKVKADLAWTLDQLAKLQEAGPSIVYRDREVVKTVKDTEEIDRLNSVIASLNARISELEAQISSHVCPEAGVEYVYVPEYIYVPVQGDPSTGSGTPEYTSQQPEAVWPGEGDGSTITSPDRSGGSTITGGN